MFKAVIGFLSVFGVSKLCAQNVLTTVKLGSQHAYDFQSFQSGDTLFVSYFEFNEPAQAYNHKALHIFPNGLTESIYFSDMPQTTFCGFENHSEGTYYYYLQDVNEGSAIKTLFNSNETRKVLPGVILINDQIIDLVDEKGLLVLTRNQAKT